MTLTLGFVFAVLTILVLSFLLPPLLRGHVETPTRAKFDMVVYRDQLTEVERDIERGLMTPEQAQAARDEIHRRMLAAEDAELEDVPAGYSQSTRRARILAAAVVAASLLLMAGGLYAYLGAPELPAKPFAARTNDPEYALAGTVGQMEAALKEKPSAEGFRKLAQTLIMMKRYDEAAQAYREAADLNPKDAATWSALGEAVSMASEGMVVPESLSAFYKAYKLDKTDARAQFYIGLAETQIGDFKKAVAIWRNLVKQGPGDAAWMGMVEEHIEVYAREGKFDPRSVTPAPPAIASLDRMLKSSTPHGAVSMHPPAGEPAAAMDEEPPKGEMPGWAKDPKQRDEMIRSMVSGLAEKMKENPGDADGWMRLANAYKVLGEKDKARAAWKKALSALPSDSSKRDEVQGELDALSGK